MLSCALNSSQPVFGVDLHKAIPKWGTVHLVVTRMGWAAESSSKIATNVKVGSGFAVGCKHDLGYGAIHLGVNLLLPLVILGASNKSHFGSASVRCAKGKLACSSCLVFNFQIDCESKVKLPTSICVSGFNTVQVGFTFMDILAGLLSCLLDIAYDKLLEYVGGKIKDRVFHKIRNIPAIRKIRIANVIKRRIGKTIEKYVAGRLDARLPKIILKIGGQDVSKKLAHEYGKAIYEKITDLIPNPAEYLRDRILGEIVGKGKMSPKEGLELLTDYVSPLPGPK